MEAVGKIKDLYYADGYLITIEETGDDTFKISAWVSGSCAMGHTTKAEYKNGAWQTKAPDRWIS